jgi:hypothetical protein
MDVVSTGDGVVEVEAGGDLPTPIVDVQVPLHRFMVTVVVAEDFRVVAARPRGDVAEQGM